MKLWQQKLYRIEQLKQRFILACSLSKADINRIVSEIYMLQNELLISKHKRRFERSYEEEIEIKKAILRDLNDQRNKKGKHDLIFDF